MSMEEFLQYIMTPVGLGALATFFMWLIQQAKPGVKDDIAFALSVLISAALGLGAYFALPFVEKLPPEVAIAVWPVLVWAWNYLWFRFGPKEDKE